MPLNTLEPKLNEVKHEDLPHEPPPAPPGKSHGWVWAVVVCLLVAGLVVWVVRRPPPAQSGAGRRGFGMMAVPVTTAVARKGDIHVYTNALGTVVPVYTDYVKSRVDGQIMEVKYTEGQMVRVGDPLVEIDPRPYQAQWLQMEGQWKRDTALLTNALVDLKRYQLAFASNAIPEQQLATQEAAVQQYQGLVELDEGALSNAVVQLIYCHLTAQIAGRVGLRQVDPGNIVHATDTSPLATIVQLQPITVVFAVAEDCLPEIQQQVSQGQELTVEAWDRDMQKKLAIGTVKTLDNLIDTNTATVRLRAQFANQDCALFPGQFVNAKLLLRTERDATLVPSDAVQRSADGSFVYLVQTNETVAIHPVKVGPSEGDNTAVEGLEPDAIIAADNFNRLQDGAKIAVRKPEERPQQPAGAYAANAREALGARKTAEDPAPPSGISAAGATDPAAVRKAAAGPKKGRGQAGKLPTTDAAASHE